MPTYKKCPPEVLVTASSVLMQHASHKPVLDAGVTIDFVFAFADCNEKGEPINDALKQYGMPALGLCKIIACDRRAKGESDAEIKLDGDWWGGATPEERLAVLDHELHHIMPVSKGTNVSGNPIWDLDSNGRPKLRLRKHDVQFGWFDIVAQRNGAYSQERIQARSLITRKGQLYWPEIMNQGQEASRVAHMEVARGPFGAHAAAP